MLQIRLSKPACETGASAKPVSVDNVTVACPDHLVLADLPVAKSLGFTSASAVVKTVGRRSRRLLGERVHFCVRCDFPIAIYGRLSPCEHTFCLDCARSDSLCYLCDERIQKIQTIKMMEGIFICAAPHCLKSFLKKTDLESHIHEIHADLLELTREKEGNESEAISAQKPSASETTVQAPTPKPIFSPHSNSQFQDREDKTPRLQNRDPSPLRRTVQQPRSVPPFPGQVLNHTSEQHPPEGSQTHGFDRVASQNRFPQQSFDSQGQGGPRQDVVNPNQAMAPSQLCYPPYVPDGVQRYFGAPYEMARPDSTPETGSGQGSLLGFTPGPTGPINFPPNYPQQWNMGPGKVALEPPLVVASQGTIDGFMNVDRHPPQSRGFFRGNYGQNVGNMIPSNVPKLAANSQGVDLRGGHGILAPQPLPLPPPRMPHPHLTQMQQQGGGSSSYPGDGNHDAPPGFGWSATET